MSDSLTGFRTRSFLDDRLRSETATVLSVRAIFGISKSAAGAFTWGNSFTKEELEVHARLAANAEAGKQAGGPFWCWCRKGRAPYVYGHKPKRNGRTEGIDFRVSVAERGR